MHKFLLVMLVMGLVAWLTRDWLHELYQSRRINQNSVAIEAVKQELDLNTRDIMVLKERMARFEERLVLVEKRLAA
ncbi:MAG: hypothetical protein E6Q06_04185 [Candidatus Moraniibacteriota bacterium]|nr:MAG: hypothetical protein E6Q06_04185 [Candidatus Moranbacteria bacterium]